MGNLVDDLTTIVGPRAVLLGADIESSTIDQRGTYRGDAVALVRPKTTGEVGAVVTTAAAHGAVIVAQGGNTGLSGGAVPTATGPISDRAFTAVRRTFLSLSFNVSMSSGTASEPIVTRTSAAC